MHSSLVPAVEASEIMVLGSMNGGNRKLISDAVGVNGNSDISVQMVTTTMGMR
jgi:hypothetical protein